MVPAIQDKNASHPAFMWNDDQLHWDSFPLENTCPWQFGDDQVSSIWAQSFFYNSATAELHERVYSKYKYLSA